MVRLTSHPSGRANRAPLNVSFRRMTDSWRTYLSESLREAGLDASILHHEKSAEDSANDVAALIVRNFREGSISWETADILANQLCGPMFECQELPSYAWDVYLAFDAGEYHPDTPELTDDEVTVSVLNRIENDGHA